MYKHSLLLTGIMLISACGGEPVKPDVDHGYFADALNCTDLSQRSEKVMLANPGVAGSVNIPLGYDAGEFLNCMAHAGRPVAKADLNEYLMVSNACLHEARSARKSADQAYADCIRRSSLNVEVLDQK